MTALATRGRSMTALGFILGGGLGTISATQVWLWAVRSDASEPLAVTGGDALSVLLPLSLTALALAAAVAIVGVALRYIFAAIGLIVGTALTVMIVRLIATRPLSAVGPTVTEMTGLAGDAAVADIVDHITTTAWPVVALVGSVLVIVSSLLALVTARSWRTGGRRFETSSTPHTGPIDAVDSWDDLSRGDDPTR